jgi:uncharacterized protein YjbI with pentapeptide repeats/membrane protein implicated in regulation of membrane protease activity
VTIALLVALLVVNRDAVKWEDLLARERIEQVALFIGIAVAATTLIVLLAVGGASLGWTGFADKTLWEWLQLLGTLAIPVVLAAAGLWFTAQQDQRQVTIEDQRADQAQKIENQRAEAEQDLAKQRAQDEALQAYLGQMSQLLLEKGLRGSKEDSVVRTLARARTAAVIQRLDGPRNRTVIRFLNEAHLIGKGQASIRLLAGADLQGGGLYKVDLGHTYLHKANLRGTNLGEANLSGANLSGANLRGTKLDEADLSGADLYDANLQNANLSDANLRHATLSRANLIGANLITANLYDADARHATLSRAKLCCFANLGHANLRHAYMIGANLSNKGGGWSSCCGANLRDANLGHAWLGDVDLNHARHVTDEQLEKAETLAGATMPDGQILKGGYEGFGDEAPNGPTFEEWRKDK